MPASSTSGSQALDYPVKIMVPILYGRLRHRSFTKATGNLRAVQILLEHRKIESTVRYFGVDVEDALTLAEGTEI
jgi:hypothetical protein